MDTVSTAVCLLLHDDHWFLEQALGAWKESGPVFAFVSRKAWDGSEGDWQRCVRILESAGAEVILGEWLSEDEHRRFALKTMRERGLRHVLIPDGDEIIEPKLLASLLGIASGDLADRVYVRWDTYWKDAMHVIRPREGFTPLVLINVQAVEHLSLRNYGGGRSLLLGEEHGIIHHLSYAGPDERIARKIATWGHKDEVVPNWWQDVWLAYDENSCLRNLHPTHPPAYGLTERIETPEILGNIPSYGRDIDFVQPPADWPTVSVIIPLCGGEDDLRLCLDSLQAQTDLIHEVIVVDNDSADGAKEIARGYSFVTLFENESNEGFAKACNKGFEASSGDVAVFLNSDTIVPRAGLVRLIESLMESPAIAAAGPLTNNCGHLQQIDPTYFSPESMPLFAEDFALRMAPDEEVDMLVGFCLAVRRSALNEVGLFDERFGLGTFEDNDLCYRFRRKGYRLVISTRSFIHHSGSKTFHRERIDARKLLQTNKRAFIDKWREDLEVGFVNGLSGMQGGRLVFNPARSPETLRRRTEGLARQADISLCMIVRNEERVLADCLMSAKLFFKEMIVVDTGSTDRTVEIAKEHGAQVHEILWPDSFAEARNESLRHATGKWIFWLDADDTLPRASGEEIIQAAINAPKELAGFVVPVQFVEDGPGAGTRVDHVKLFRNFPDVRFEGRIHEQILGTLRAHGDIARIDAVVMHSGYDTSVEGQAKKRVRDDKLLKLDLKERPDHPFVLFNLGMTAHFCGDHKAAVKWLKKSIAKAQEGESHVRKAYALMAVSQRELGKQEEALQSLLEGLALVGEDPELRFHAGLLLTGMSRFEEAYAHYIAAPDTVDSHFSSVDIGILHFKRYHNLASVCIALNRYEEAKDWWLKAMKSAPSFLPSAFELFDTALHMKDLPGAQLGMEHVRQQEGPSESWAKMVDRYAEAVGGLANAEGLLSKASKDFPGEPGPLLVLSRRLLASERIEEAMGPLDELQRMGVAEAAHYLGIAETRRGNFVQAAVWMDRAVELDPASDQSRQQAVALRAAIAGEAP